MIPNEERVRELMAEMPGFDERFSTSPVTRRIEHYDRPIWTPPPKPEPVVIPEVMAVTKRPAPAKKSKSGPGGKSTYKPAPMATCGNCGGLFRRAGIQRFCQAEECRKAHIEFVRQQTNRMAAERRRKKGIAARQAPEAVIPKDECPHTDWRKKKNLPGGVTLEWCWQCKAKYRRAHD